MLPALAVECSLVGIKPNVSRNARNTWDKDLVIKIKNMIDEECDLEERFPYGKKWCEGGHLCNFKLPFLFGEY